MIFWTLWEFQFQNKIEGRRIKNDEIAISGLEDMFTSFLAKAVNIPPGSEMCEHKKMLHELELIEN